MTTTTFDFETYLIVEGTIPKAVCCAIQTGNLPPALYLAADAVPVLMEAMTAGHILVAHNVPFDLTVLMKCAKATLPDREARAVRDAVWKHLDDGLVSCTLVRSLLMSIADGSMQEDRKMSHSLESVVRRLLGQDIGAAKHGPDSWRMRYGELDGVALADYEESARAYPLSDATNTTKVWTEQARVGGIPVEANGLLRDEAAQVRAAMCLHLMGINGINADGEAVGRLANKVRGELARSEQIEREAGLLVWGGTKNEPKEVRPQKPRKARVQAAYEKMGLEVPLTDGGGVSIAAETLDVVTEAADPVLYQLAKIGTEYGTVAKTFLPALQKAVMQPIHPQWNVLVSTGRISCSNPNLTNQPRLEGVRECWIPQPEALFIEADYSFIELCTLAQVCLDFFGFSKLADCINAEQDPHLATAAGLLKTTYEDALVRLKQKDPEVKKARQTAKAINFGLPGGMGVKTFALHAQKQGVDMGENPVELAAVYKQVWMDTYPEMKKYLARAGELAQGPSIEQVRTGRIRTVEEGKRYSAFANGFFQGLSADGMKRALWYVTQEMYTGRSALWAGPGLSPLLGSRMVAAVHDEFIGESPINKAPEAADRMGVLMVAGMREFTPDVLVKAEPLLMSRWCKSAEPVRVNGRLVVWEAK